MKHVIAFQLLVSLEWLACSLALLSLLVPKAEAQVLTANEKLISDAIRESIQIQVTPIKDDAVPKVFKGEFFITDIATHPLNTYPKPDSKTKRMVALLNGEMIRIDETIAPALHPAYSTRTFSTSAFSFWCEMTFGFVTTRMVRSYIVRLSPCSLHTSWVQTTQACGVCQ